MRPFETWLLAALSLALLILSVPHWRRTRWPRMSAVVALLIGAAQILTEGPRWQLLPAYALTVLLCWFSDLVSHGYVVVALDQPGVAAAVVFPDGHQAAGLTLAQFQPVVRPSYMPEMRHLPLGGLPQPGGKAPADNSIVPYLAKDVAFALDLLATLNQADPAGILAGKLDLQRVGAFGISLGGIVVGDACRVDPRLRACLMMDAPVPIGVVRAGLKQPGMWLTRDAASVRLERQRAGGWPEALAQVLGLGGPINGRRAHNILNAYSLAFFDRELRGRACGLLDGPSVQYPEVTFDARQP